MAERIILYCVLLISLSSQASLVWGHGRLIEPAARNTAWRSGFAVPKNFNDNEQNCGGVGIQWSTNGGKCGVCGDPYNGPQPHVYPGKYATGVIAKNYTTGQTIQAKIDITANHKGWFEFRLGKLDEKPITQSKLTHLLKLTNGETRWYLESVDNKVFVIDVKLPDDVTCDHCVLQWWWNSGNSWGCNENNMCGVGYGPQETYSNCADIRILSTGGEIGAAADNETAAQTTTTTAPTPTPRETTTNAAQAPYTDSVQETVTNAQAQPTTISEVEDTTVAMTTESTYVQVTQSSVLDTQESTTDPQPATTGEPETATRPLARSVVVVGCHAIGVWEGDLLQDKWCYDNCSRGYCPSIHCACAFMA